MLHPLDESTTLVWLAVVSAWVGFAVVVYALVRAARSEDAD